MIQRSMVPAAVALFVLSSLFSVPSLAGDAAGQETVVFLVRHAEKEETDPGSRPADPALTAEGAARAEALASTLADAGLSRVLSTGYRRTLDTAAPVAARLGLEVERYAPDALEALARELLEVGGRVLVVGHSNTTPELVQRLGGDPGPPIAEPWEYDRLYLVAPAERGMDGEVRTILLRYGAPSLPP